MTASATPSTPTSASPPFVKLDVRAIALLGIGHVSDDINQSFLPALLPLLVAQRHLTFQAAASLVFAQAVSSSVVQPAIGYVADKRPMPWLAGVGLLLAGGGIAAIGFMPTYALIFICALISGLGVAMFHPEAARFANLASGTKKASGMRWFAVGGNIGFSIGPAFATIALVAFGITGTFVVAIPVAVMGTLLILETKRFRTFLPRLQRGAKAPARVPDDWSAFGRLTAFVMLRSTAYLGLVSFIPLYFVHVVHVSPAVGNLVLTTFLLAGIGGTIVGGPLADRHGRRAVIFISMAITLAFVALFAFTTDGTGVAPLVAGFVCALGLGFFVAGSQAPTIVLAQDYLPNRLGMASGVTLGLAVSVGGMFSPVLGAIGDRFGLHASILAIVALTALSLAVGLTMPSNEKRRALLLQRATPAV
uniref:Fosmidomycin resistance protein n=1 Tax=uncultured organism TaxID=155900 RepID=A0A7L9QBQ5_9ZZZZ|nr:fosmidomycin resistance protein [uncultured organism]